MNMRTKQNKQIKQSKQWTLGIIAGTLVLTLAVLCGYELWGGWRGRSANGVRSGVPQFMLPWKRLAAGTSSGGTIAPQIPPAEFPGAIALLKPPPAAQLPAMWRQPATVRVTLPSWLSAAKPIHFPNDKPSDPQPVDSKATLPSWLTTEGPIHFTHDKLPGSSRQIGVLASKPVVIPDFRMRFVTAMCLDQQGHIWIATEGDGVWCYDPAASAGQRYVGFDVENTDGQLGNNDIDAIACDNHNRIWAGTLNHGVSVYNGQRWQDYDIVQNPQRHILAGPLGDRVFALKFDQYTNQMWICTDAGISIYECSPSVNVKTSPVSLSTAGRSVSLRPRERSSHYALSGASHCLFAPGTWHYITQANGLPQNPDCVAFAPDGTVYVGTQCGGVAIGKPTFKPWRVITGPWKMPVTATGKGLPGNLVNCVLAAPSGYVFVGTDSGLSSSANHGRTFHYQRGQNFPGKVEGLWHPPVDWYAPSAKILAMLPASDCTTVLAWQKIPATKSTVAPGSQSAVARLWIGHRRGGCDVWELDAEGKVIQRRTAAGTAFSSFITCLLPLPGGKMAMGTYGGGMRMITLPGTKNAWIATPGDGVAGTTNLHIAAGSAGGHRADSGTPITMHEPKSATPPTQEQLTKLTRRLTAVFKNTSSKQPAIVPISDDWRMQGTWLGRYGRYWACLFACMYPPRDYIWEPGIQLIHHEEAIGPHHSQSDIPGGDTIRYYVTWPFSQRRRVLELPEVYLDSQVIMQMTTWNLDRRETEIDDHGEMYNTTWQGPDIYVYLHIPAGVYTLSLYFVNKDGHTRQARNRDYPISMIPLPISYHLISTAQFNTAPLAEMRGIAQSRVVNFWGGVWKRFIVRGPMKLAIRVAKNDSLDTILSGAMLDQLAEHPAPYYYGYTAWQTHEKQQTAFRTRLAAAWRSGHIAAGFAGGGTPARNPALAAQLLQILNVLEHRDPAAWAANQQLAYSMMLRWCVARYGAIPQDPAAAKIAEKCYYHLNLFNRWEAVERSLGILTSRQIEKGLRWDPETAFLSIHGFQAVRSYVRDLDQEEGKTQAKRE